MSGMVRRRAFVAQSLLRRIQGIRPSLMTHLILTSVAWTLREEEGGSMLASEFWRMELDQWAGDVRRIAEKAPISKKAQASDVVKDSHKFFVELTEIAVDILMAEVMDRIGFDQRMILPTTLVSSISELQNICVQALDDPEGKTGIDIETSGLHYPDNEVIGVSLYVGWQGTAHYIPLRHHDTSKNLPVREVVEKLSVLGDESTFVGTQHRV